jgi:probable selenium-dependent hydroxylase accessory protein YqeC
VKSRSVHPIDRSSFAAALQLGTHEHVALVGGGGKTTLLHALGDQLTGSRVLSCTTKMGHDQHHGLRVMVDRSWDAVAVAADREPVMAWSAVRDQKAIGVEPEECDRWFERVDHVLVECDGSRRHPFKAPADYEPVIPGSVTQVLTVIGADGIGRSISASCHRPEIVAALADCAVDDELTPLRAARVLLHEAGARKAVPPGARLRVVVNKVRVDDEAAVGELVDHVESLDPLIEVVTLNWSPVLSDGGVDH